MQDTDSPDTGELASRLRLGVTRLARRLRQQAEPGITQSCLAALATIDVHGPMTIGDLCAHEQVQPPTMTRVVASLVTSGFVERETDAGDRRVAWVRTTADGRKVLQRSRKRKEAFLAKRLRALEPRQLETLEEAVGILEQFVESPQ
ncbi:MAG: MarR family transcriptional regulator [Actinomycetota bacterium]